MADKRLYAVVETYDHGYADGKRHAENLGAYECARLRSALERVLDHVEEMAGGGAIDNEDAAYLRNVIRAALSAPDASGEGGRDG